MTPAELKTLRALSDQRRERDMAALTAARQKAGRVDARVMALQEKVNAQSSAIQATDLAVTAKWLGWAEQEKYRLLAEHAALKLRAETARRVAAHSDAKTRVIGRLLSDALAEALRDTRRRAEQMGREPDK